MISFPAHRRAAAREGGFRLRGLRTGLARRGVSMRWWLALAFAAVAALTAVSVAALFSQRSAGAVQERAEELATARAFAASVDIGRAADAGTLRASLPSIEIRRSVALYVYDERGRLISTGGSQTAMLDRLPFHHEALRDALGGRRFLRSVDNGREVLVGLPFSGHGVAAVLAVSDRRGIPTTLDLLRRKVFESAGLAVLVGAFAGLLIALLIGRRLRRIADAAAAIEAGNFEQTLAPGFHDELGNLAGTVDRMRSRLAESFAALESERDRLGLILAELHEGVLAVDRNLVVTFANPEAARILGTQVEAGTPLPDPWPGFSLRSFAASLFEASGQVERTHLATHGDEAFGVTAVPARGGETAVLVLSDVSAAERRERAEREFVTNAAHELRTPLQTIVGAVEMLQAGAKEEPAERDMFLAHVERETARLTRLVRALLVLARAQTREASPALAPVDLRPLLDEVAVSVRPRSTVPVEVECPPSLVVDTHRDLFEEALMNLAANAVKHTRRGTVVLAARASGDDVVAEVRDTGSGIPPEHRLRVRDRFYRAENRTGEGFGLGLAIAAQAVRAVGGTLDIDSEPGRGTTVQITIPAAESKAA